MDKIILTRLPCVNSYQFSKIIYGKELECSSLEVKDCHSLVAGIYSLKLRYRTNELAPDIQILNIENEVVSYMVANNNYRWKDVIIRNNSNFISIGIQNETLYLQECDHMFFKIVEIIRRHTLSSDTTLLQII